MIMQQNDKIDIKKMLIIINKNNWPENFNLKKSINKNSQIIIDNQYYFIARINFM
jgi:mRNA-degrading endonuclease HigB of HigAB toxin-antitoxin module